LLTGAGGRLGRQLLNAYADHITFVAVYRKSVPKVASQLAQPFDPLDPDGVPAGREAPYLVQANLRDPGALARVVEIALARHDRIDHVVNAAADVTFHGSLLEASNAADRLSEQLLLNCITPALLAAEVCRAFWRDRPDENRARRRSVVNISSNSGLNVFTGLGQGGYSASKAALQFMSYHMAADYQSIGVRVNVLAPDRFPDAVPTATVADAVAELLGNEANGTIFLVDRDGPEALN
jgi:NAD(P)-dependent dehydrogenase (short-subunit alcohol dehydrogenase family)